MSFFQKGKVNEEYRELDLLLDSKFYEQYDPVIVSLKTPVKFPEFTIQKNTIPANTLSQFIMRKRELKKLINLNPNNELTIQKSNSNKLITITHQGLIYDLDNNPKEKVFEILNHKITKQTNIYKLSGTDFLLDIAENIAINSLTMKRNLLPAALTAIIEKDMPASLLVEHIGAKAINCATYRSWLSSDEKIQTIKDKFQELFKPFIIDIGLNIVESNGVFTLSVIDRDMPEFTDNWFKCLEKVNQDHIFNRIENPILEFTPKEKVQFKTELIIAKSQRDSVFDFDNYTLQHLINHHTEDELQEIYKSLNNAEFANVQLGNNLQKQIKSIKSINKRLLKIENTDDYVEATINWKKLTIEKFPQIETSLDTTYLLKDLIIKKHNFNHCFSDKEYPLLKEFMNHFSKIRQTIDETVGIDEFEVELNRDKYIKITDKGLIFRLHTHGKLQTESLKEIAKHTVENISNESFANFSNVEIFIKKVILEDFMGKPKPPEDNNEYKNEFKL